MEELTADEEQKEQRRWVGWMAVSRKRLLLGPVSSQAENGGVCIGI